MDERPASADIGLTDSEQRLLDHIRAGLVDAEIAVRLGITNAEVKSRTERLATKLRVSGRDGLRAPRSPPPPVAEPAAKETGSPPLRSALLPLAVLAGLVIAFVAGLLVASLGEDDASPITADAASPTAVSPTPVGSPVPAPTQPPRIEVIDGREMEWFGPLLSVPGAGFGSVLAEEPGEDLLVVTMAGNGRILFGSRLRPSGGGAVDARLSGVGGNGHFVVTIQTGDEYTRLIHGDDNSIAVLTSAPGGHPVLVLRAASGDGPRYHLRTNSNGELFVATAATPRTVIIDERTGELIETSDATRVWSVTVPSGGFFFNRCQEGPCDLVISGAEMRTPSPGRVSCPQPGVVLLELASAPLTFTQVRRTTLDAHCELGTVGEGDVFAPPAHYVVTSSLPDGTPLSIAAKLDGTVWVGTFRGTVGCPCLTGN